MNFVDKRFIIDEGNRVTRLGEQKIQDALMQKDGIMEVTLESGEAFGFFFDEDVLLKPFKEGWVPVEENDAWQIAQPMDYWPDSLLLMINSESTF